MLAQNHKQTPSSDLQDQLTNFNQHSPDPDNQFSLDLHEDDESSRKIGKWTTAEDELLRKYVPLFGEKQWRKISEHIPGRTSIQCLHRWTKILKPGLVKGPWTSEEDQKLLAWVKKEGATKWAQCANFIKGRSGKQCRERWFNNLNPDVKKGNWLKEEDELIFELYQKYGSSWSKIAKFIPGRTENAIKNRFYSTLRRLTADKRKDPSEVGGNPCVKDVRADSTPEMGMPVQPPNALYMLLNNKASVLPSQEDIKRETSVTSQKKVALTPQKSEKGQQMFNINGERFIVARNNNFTEDNVQGTMKKLFASKIDDNDNAFENFLVSLDSNHKVELPPRTINNMNIEPPQREPEQVQVNYLESLQGRILNFCQTNIKDISKSFKMIDTTKPETSQSDLMIKPAAPMQVPFAGFQTPPMNQLDASNMRGTTILTPVPNTQKAVPFGLQNMNKKTIGTVTSPIKGPSATGFSLYNPLNARASSKNASENSSDNVMMANTNMNQHKMMPQVLLESENLNRMADKNLFMPSVKSFPQINQSNLMSFGHQKAPMDHMNQDDESEKRMNYLFKQLFSLEVMIAKTKNDLLRFENCLQLQEKEQENVVKVEEPVMDINYPVGKQLLMQRSLEKLNSEFEHILKKKKV